MSDTPRTDEAERHYDFKEGMADFARRLERELAETRTLLLHKNETAGAFMEQVMKLQKEIAASQVREIDLTDDLEDIANMPKIDQDDEHRLRHKAQKAVEKWRKAL
mgnify:CR=1 FL=1